MAAATGIGGLARAGAVAAATLLAAWAGEGRAETVCYKSGTELDFSKSDMQNTRDKLENGAYFGPGAAVAPEALDFASLGTVTEAGLISAGCDIFTGGGFEGSLSAAEGAELLSWSTGPRDVVVVGGCDLDSANQTCLAFNRTLTDIPNGGMSLNENLAYNPLTCGGVDGVNTYGGRSTYLGLGPAGTDITLANHNSAGQEPAVTTDSLIDPQFLFTADADMFGSDGSTAIGGGATASGNQAVFVLNVFKFVLDGIHDRLRNAQCFDDYNTLTDLALALSATPSTVELGGTTTLTVAVENQSGQDADRVAVEIALPEGLDYASESGDGSYDEARDTWEVGAVPAGTTRTIQIVATTTTGSSVTVRAEIVRANLPDVDSAPNETFGNDDLADGVADDDEASTTISFTSGATLAGQVFLDDGSGGATAHDGQRAGGEIGAPVAVVGLYDGSGTLFAAPDVAGDGTWSHALPSTYAEALTVAAAAMPGYVFVSERTAGLPGLSNADPSDGQFTFSPSAGTDYTALDIGLVAVPELAGDNEAVVAPGQTASLPHRYAATTAASVSFAFVDTAASPAEAFSATLYADTDCDGTADAVLAGATTVAAGQTVCLVSRVAVSGGAGPGAALSYRLVATSALTGLAKVLTAEDTDAVRAGAAGGERLVLAKSVRNITAGSALGTANTGDIGDVLEYHITLHNPGAEALTGVVVHDRTPIYTRLSEPLPSPVTVTTGVTCTVTAPAPNVAGHEGPIAWDCPGSFPPGGRGTLTFRVSIVP